MRVLRESFRSNGYYGYLLSERAEMKWSVASTTDSPVKLFDVRINKNTQPTRGRSSRPALMFPSRVGNMSGFEYQLGWFHMQFGEKRERLCYRCNVCSSFTMCGDGQKRAFCCGQWKTPPKETFWGGKLPRVPYVPPRGPVILPGKVSNFTD